MSAPQPSKSGKSSRYILTSKWNRKYPKSESVKVMVNIKTHPETLKELRAQDPEESTKGFSSERQPTWNPDFYLPSHRNDIGPIKLKVPL